MVRTRTIYGDDYGDALGSTVVLAVFIVLAFIFLATTIDSAAYTLSFRSSQAIDENQEPQRWIRVFWALMIGTVAVTLMYGGGLGALQTLSVITGFPVMIICIIITISLFKWLKEDHAKPINAKISLSINLIERDILYRDIVTPFIRPPIFSDKHLSVCLLPY